MNTKRIISLVLLLFVSSLFSYKYLARYIDFPLAAAFLLALGHAALYFLSLRLPDKKILHNTLKALTVVYILAFIVLFRLLPVESLNVDRWSVIQSFWDTFFAGGYPYKAQSHMGNNPGPLPMYFVMALPFYLIGEIGYLAVLGFLLFAGIYFLKRTSLGEKAFPLLFLMTSPLMFWEISTRSTIFVNAVLVLIYIMILHKTNFGSYRNLIICGIFGGLLIATRNVFLLPLAIAMMSIFLRKNITTKQVITGGIFVFAAFILSFVPLLIMFGSEMLEVNPLIIQYNQLLPGGYATILIFVSLILAALARNDCDTYFYSGIMLFLAVAVYFAYHGFMVGFYEAYMASVVDISYFIFCVPFLLWGMRRKELN